MKIIKERAYQIYKVSPEYSRFDQKFNMARRKEWDWTDFGKIANQNRIERMKNGSAGYGLNDWALFKAAGSLNQVAHTDVNVPNRGHTSWSEISATLPPGVEKLKEDPRRMSRYIRKVAHLFGADLVGFTRLDRRWVYSHWYDPETKESYPILFSDETDPTCQKPAVLNDRSQVIPKEMESVIVMAVAMDKEGIEGAPTLKAMSTLATAYGKLGSLSLVIAEFIRGMGYTALPMINDTGPNVPLAIDAGLGQAGRHGLLITPQFGPRLRICKVLTDLPLDFDWPIDFGVTAFCHTCKKCADHCPADAISKGERSYEAGSISSNGGALKWSFSAEQCRTYQMKIGSNCCVCVRVCPFNKSSHWIHSVVRGFMANFPQLNPFIVKMDDVLGYGKFKDPEVNFWRSE